MGISGLFLVSDWHTYARTFVTCAGVRCVVSSLGPFPISHTHLPVQIYGWMRESLLLGEDPEWAAGWHVSVLTSLFFKLFHAFKNLQFSFFPIICLLFLFLASLHWLGLLVQDCQALLPILGGEGSVFHYCVCHQLQGFSIT